MTRQAAKQVLELRRSSSRQGSNCAMSNNLIGVPLAIGISANKNPGVYNKHCFHHAEGESLHPLYVRGMRTDNIDITPLANYSTNNVSSKLIDNSTITGFNIRINVIMPVPRNIPTDAHTAA